MEIVEAEIFTRCINELMPDDEYAAFQAALIERPDMGELIRGGSGLRKVRWKLDGKGQSSGARIIYYWANAENQLRMIFAYKKARQEDLSPEQLKLLRRIIERW